MKHLPLIILFFIVQTAPSFAEKEKKITAKEMSLLGKIDESNFKQPEAKAIDSQPKKYETKMTMTCKEEDGREFKQGEVGYDNCLNGLRNRSELSKRNSGVYGSDKKDQSGTGVNFKIGD